MSSTLHLSTIACGPIHYPSKPSSHLMNPSASTKCMFAVPAFLFGICLFAGSLFSSHAKASDQVPGARQKNPILIKNATVHTVSQGTFPSTSILVKDGKIAEVGANIQPPENTEVIDAAGQHLYPGLIDSFSAIGLVEIDSIRASIDNTEMGNINSNVRAAVAVNPDSEAIPVARANGVLFSMVGPTGGLVSGRAALLQMDGWTWEDMTLRSDVGMMVNWPRFGGGGGGGRGGRRQAAEATEGDADSSDRLAPLHTLIRETRAYATAKAANRNLPTDLRLEAMIPVAEGRLPMIVNANTVKQIQTAIAFSKQHSLKLILMGANDALQCAALIREANVPVIVSGVYRLPSRRDAPYDSAYTFPSQLRAAGIQFSIASDGRFGASGIRNLPYHASTAAGFGLSSDDAIRSITLSPAEIFGVADRVGSIEAGKDATLFLCTGDILETPTQVTKAWIQGRKVDLTSKHTQLYEKYKSKYEQQK
ncbi:MAG: amidohydrolase family protein [Planctomycetes bacterium]|nr:amidohydrolase family protein [Planctomycetota bacterium]